MKAKVERGIVHAYTLRVQAPFSTANEDDLYYFDTAQGVANFLEENYPGIPTSWSI